MAPEVEERLPVEQLVGALRRIYHLLVRFPFFAPVLRRVVDGVFARLFLRDLHRLHDVLDGTELAGRYWVWSGVLLGWAREGRLLPHDVRDADFGLLAEDLPLLEAAEPALRRAGFRPFDAERASDGHVTDRDFYRTRRWYFARFDFKVFQATEDQLHYVHHYWHDGRHVEVECRIPRQRLVPFDFLGRVWLRPADVDLELTAMYGDWRTPRPDWKAWEGRDIFSCRIWTPPDVSEEA